MSNKVGRVGQRSIFCDAAILHSSPTDTVTNAAKKETTSATLIGTRDITCCIDPMYTSPIKLYCKTLRCPNLGRHVSDNLDNFNPTDAHRYRWRVLLFEPHHQFARLTPAAAKAICEFGIPKKNGHMMTPLEPTNLIHQVYGRIVDAIIDRSLPPGHRIRQAELAEMLGVSRQPVSHALHLLHQQGLVSESGRKGFQVSQIDPVRIRQLYEVRSVIDGLAARLAAQRIDRDPAGRAELERVLEAGCKADDSTPLSILIARDVDFHRLIYRLSGNPAIAEMVESQWLHMQRSMATVLAELDYRTSAWSEHQAIVNRIFAGDAEGAEQAARAHATTAGQVTEERLATASLAA